MRSKVDQRGRLELGRRVISGGARIRDAILGVVSLLIAMDVVVTIAAAGVDFDATAVAATASRQMPLM